MKKTYMGSTTRPLGKMILLRLIWIRRQKITRAPKAWTTISPDLTLQNGKPIPPFFGRYPSGSVLGPSGQVVHQKMHVYFTNRPSSF